jgi:hypothetical protein
MNGEKIRRSLGVVNAEAIVKAVEDLHSPYETSTRSETHFRLESLTPSWGDDEQHACDEACFEDVQLCKACGVRFEECRTRRAMRDAGGAS